MTNEEYIQACLADRKDQYKEISYRTGLTIPTLYNVAKGSFKPRKTTVDLLVKYFRRLEKRIEKSAANGLATSE